MSHKIVIDELNNVVQITAPGPQGVQGPAGTTLRYGAGAPTAGDGNNGDFWVDTTNDRLYGPKAAGAWPAEYTSLIGPANTLTIGTVTTGPTNGTAAASISGTAPNQVLDLTLPAGPTGPAINLGSALPLPLGATALAGTATSGSREDHVHASAGVTVTLLQAYVKNGSGGALSKGDAVYISGADGTNVLVSKADANSDPSSSKTLGLLSQDLAINELGYVTTEGLVSGINTASATAGQSVWLSTTAGQWVFGSPPAEPAHGVYLGVVARANANNGEILVKVQNGYELDELHDVFAGSPTNGHLLRYDSSSTAWINGQALGTSIAAGAISGTHIAVGAVGSTQIASTAVIASKISSEAAGSGNVLIANGAGGASWGVSVDPEIGTFSTVTVNFNFGTPNDFMGSYITSFSTANLKTWGIGGGGSVVLAGGISNSDTTTKTWNTFVMSSHAATGTVARSGTASSVAPSPAGTIIAGGIFALRAHEAASTAVYWSERWNITTSGSSYVSIRKYTSNLSASIWNSAVVGPQTSIGGVASEYNNRSAEETVYIPSINCWFGFHSSANASGTGGIWLVNDASGSVYKASTLVNGGGTEWTNYAAGYVPPVSSGSGTIWVLSAAGTARRAVAYAASSAGISAPLSTATSWSPYPDTSASSAIFRWDDTISKIVIHRAGSAYGIDRTFGTLEFTSSGIDARYRIGDYAVGNSQVGVFGSAGPNYGAASRLPSISETIPSTSGGSLVAILNGQTASGATATSYSVNTFRFDSEPVFGSASYGRMFWGTTGNVSAIKNMNNLTWLTTEGIAGTGYIPAGGTMTIEASSSTATGTISQTWYTLRVK